MRNEGRIHVLEQHRDQWRRIAFRQWDAIALARGCLKAGDTGAAYRLLDEAMQELNPNQADDAPKAERGEG